MYYFSVFIEKYKNFSLTTNILAHLLDTGTHSGTISNKSIDRTKNENEVDQFAGLADFPCAAVFIFPHLSTPNKLDYKRIHSLHRSQHLGTFVP